MTDSQTLKELAATLKFDYLDRRASIARIACALLNDTLADDVSFKASCELMSFGPANDWNGQRSAAARINQEWEERILTPALLVYHNLQ